MGRRTEPIAKRLKQSAESALLAKQPADDVAERIRRLEAELDSDGSSSDSESDGSDSESSADEEEDSSAVLSLSKYAAERIDALPETQLPPRRATAAALPPPLASSKKRKLPAATPVLSAAHQALLDIVHMPKRVPFACKRCGFVGADLAALEAHRQSPEHLAAQQLELRCVLCDKSFTSQAQLDEHRAGKWHQQRAQQRKERHVVRVCYDFMRGACFRGDRCGFEHAETRAVKSGKALERKRQRACAQFASGGTCKFGDRCLYSHETAA